MCYISTSQTGFVLSNSCVFSVLLLFVLTVESRALFHHSIANPANGPTLVAAASSERPLTTGIRPSGIRPYARRQQSRSSTTHTFAARHEAGTHTRDTDPAI